MQAIEKNLIRALNASKDEYLYIRLAFRVTFMKKHSYDSVQKVYRIRNFHIFVAQKE